MAVLSKVGTIEDVAAGAYLTIQPSSGVEWIIHNIMYGGAVEVYYYDGVDELLVDSDTAAGSMLYLSLHCSNTVYYRIKNVSGGSIKIGYDGVISIAA